MKKSKKTVGKDAPVVPFFAVESFRRFPSSLAWLAGPPAGKRRKALAIAEKPFRKSHVAIERLRQAPSPKTLLGLLRKLLPDLKVSPVQSTVYLAWAEVLLRECEDEERFDFRGLEMDRVALAAVFLQSASALQSTPPFQWIHLYLESLLASAPPEGNPSVALDRAAAALEGATEAGEAHSILMALTRLQDGAQRDLKETRERARPHLTLRKDGHCLLLGGAVVSLTPREFTMLCTTAEGGTLSRERGTELLAKERSLSGGANPGFVDESALQAHRRSILVKVEKEAGKGFRDLLGKAFRSKMRVFVYDATVLPFSVE